MPQQQERSTAMSERKFGKENQDKLADLDDWQTRFRERIEAAETCTDQEKSALHVRSQEGFTIFWRDTLNAKASYDFKRENKAGLLSKGATNLAATTHDVLRGISPVLELVRDFGAPFGAMAMGTVCFACVIAKNRVRMDERIITTFNNIRDQLPGIKVYQHIYNENNDLDKELQSQIVDVYKCFIDFCITTSEFYTKGSSHRWLRTLQINTDIDERGARVEAAVVRMRLTCEGLLSRNVEAARHEIAEVKMMNKNLESQIVKLQGQVSELQDNTDKVNLQRASQLLDVTPLPNETIHDNLVKHRRNLTAVFSRKNSDYSETAEESSSSVENDPVYKDWVSSPESRVLIFSGVNDNRWAEHCWLSPVALNLIDRLKVTESSHDSDPCVFYLLGHRDEEDTWPSVLAFLIYQLLDLNKKALRNEEQCRQLWGDLESYNKARQLPVSTREEVSEKVARTLDTIEKIATSVLGILGTVRTVWVVLDRVDKCETMPGDMAQANNRGGRTLLRSMIRIAEKAKVAERSSVAFKVLAVVNRADWRIEEQVDDLGNERDGKYSIRTYRQSGKRLYGDL